jgi:hypothetical protein
MRSSSTWTDPRGVEHFKGRGPFMSSRAAPYAAAALFAGGGVYYVSSLEEVPYTHRCGGICGGLLP